MKDGVRSLKVLLAVQLGLVGCDAAGVDSMGPDAGGGVASGERLTVLEQDEGAGELVLRFEKNDDVITYDMRLGRKMAMPPTSEEMAKDPEQPVYETDVRVLDADGQPFLLQLGGDGFIDAGWKMPAVKDFDEGRRLRAFSMLRDAVPALRRLKMLPGLEQLRLAAIRIGLNVQTVPEKPDLTDASGSYLQGPVEWGPASVVKWDFLVRKKNQGAGIVGHHSAVLLRGWSASTNVVFQVASCNHGTCADVVDKMSTHCVMPGFLADDGTHSRYFYWSACTTDFDWDSTSALGGAHNCNDDSELQIRAIYDDAPQCTTCGSCSALGFHNYAPGCNRP
jgi:hypothetical protein